MNDGQNFTDAGNLDTLGQGFSRPVILVVDDTPENLSLMAAILKEEFKVKVANNGEKALAIARLKPPPDLIFLDIMMPEMDGYEVCARLKASPETRDIPVIFLTALSEMEDEKRGLEIGALDYITKPVSPPILIARAHNHLKLKLAADFLRDENLFLEEEVNRRTNQIRAVQEVTILALASLAETRDNETGNHLKRTQEYIKCLALKLKEQSKYAPKLSDTYLSLIIKSAPLHDIGKVGIPDSILLKPGQLDPKEFEVMKTHTHLGKQAIENAERSLGFRVDFLSVAKEITFSHHEKWDGTGYPEGLIGEAIPLAARLMAIADVYDALISRRVYKEPLIHAKAAEMILEGSGVQFDPELVSAFKFCVDGFRDIACKHADKWDDQGGSA
jgi:putative two-component system response regulator